VGGGTPAVAAAGLRSATCPPVNPLWQCAQQRVARTGIAGVERRRGPLGSQLGTPAPAPAPRRPPGSPGAHPEAHPGLIWAHPALQRAALAQVFTPRTGGLSARAGNGAGGGADPTLASLIAPWSTRATHRIFMPRVRAFFRFLWCPFPVFQRDAPLLMVIGTRGGAFFAAPRRPVIRTPSVTTRRFGAGAVSLKGRDNPIRCTPACCLLIAVACRSLPSSPHK
jgi:hypothetical protein